MNDPLLHSVNADGGWQPGTQCLASYTVLETEYQRAGTLNTYASGTEPYWNGENIQMEPSWEKVCTSATDRLNFRIYVPETGADAEFTVTGPITKTQDLGHTVFGFPMAEYQLPENIYHSRDGKYSIYGGRVRTVCYEKLVQVNLYTWQIRLDVYRTYHYESFGGIRVNVTALGGGESGPGYGWDRAGSKSGSGTGWQQALNTYLAGGGCTSGWEIWVDDEQRCDANGNEMNQT